MMEIGLALLFAISTFFFAVPAHAQSWSGEWSRWTQKNTSFSGANLRVNECKDSICTVIFKSEDLSGQTCGAEGEIKLPTDDHAETEVTLKKKVNDCKLILQKKAGPPASMHAEFRGDDCKQYCTSPKALVLPADLVKISDSPSLDPLPFPKCQASSSAALQELCFNSELAKSYLKAARELERARSLQQSFYVAKEMQVSNALPFWESCKGDETKECVKRGVKEFGDEVSRGLTRVQKLKNQLEADLKSLPASGKAQAEIETLKGKYEKKIKSGTASGDKFEVTNDVSLVQEEGDLGFDVLLNFFDEQECTLSGSAQHLKSGRFLYKESGSNCRLLIFKEGDDLVLTDEPPGSCRKHCGKGASFYNARFPLASRSTKAAR